jgi:hypothetical protein
VSSEEPSMRVSRQESNSPKIMKMVSEVSTKVLVITSIQEGKYTEWVLPVVIIYLAAMPLLFN